MHTVHHISTINPQVLGVLFTHFAKDRPTLCYAKPATPELPLRKTWRSSTGKYSMFKGFVVHCPA